MGSFSDLGSYPAVQDAQAREAAIALQTGLCEHVPNGGEVIYNPLFSNFEQACSTLQRMRVSYLNRFHDRRALDSWGEARVQRPGLWQGMDGLNYIERHLGYRFVLRDVRLRRQPLRREIRVRLRLENVGFAPPYHRLTPRLLLCQEDDVKVLPMRWTAGPRFDRTRSQRENVAETSVRLRELPRTGQELRFCLWSEKYQREILLGNEGHERIGYSIGGLEAK